LQVGRENCNSLPPFWTAAGSGSSAIYTNTLTNFETPQRPEPLRCV
jgi:hypothetical protein